MAEQFSNNAVSTLTGSIAAIGTSLTVQAGHGARFPSPGASDFFRLVLVRKSDGAYEIVFCTVRSGDILTITRAQESTTALAFVASDIVELRPTAGFFSSLAVTSSNIQNNAFTYDATDTGSLNFYIINPSPAIADYTAGQEFWFIPASTSSGAGCQLNVSALVTSPTIRLPNNSGPYAGAIQTGKPAHVIFDGTYFILQNPYNFASVAGLITRSHTDINNLVTLAGAETLSSKTLTSPVLNGALSGTAFLNEATLVSNSAIAAPSQQSVKAYVDNRLTGATAITGISFGNETLSVYDEGTWTPTIQDATGSDAEGQTYSVNTGVYLRIGKLVFINGIISMASLGTLTTSDQVRIAGMPVASGTANTIIAVGRAFNLALGAAGDSVHFSTEVSQSLMTGYVWSATGGTSNFTLAMLTATGSIRFSGVYRVA